MAAERLQYREDDLARRCIDRQTLDEVEPAVRARVVLLVQTVQVHHPEQLLAVDALRTFVQVLYVRSYRVVTVGHVEFEFLLIDARRP